MNQPPDIAIHSTTPSTSLKLLRPEGHRRAGNLSEASIPKLREFKLQGDTVQRVQAGKGQGARGKEVLNVQRRQGARDKEEVNVQRGREKRQGAESQEG